MSADLTNVELMPIWKKGADTGPGDRFRELALMADKNPERFAKLVVIYVEDNGKGDVTRYANYGVTTMELLGMLRMAEVEVFRVTQE